MMLIRRFKDERVAQGTFWGQEPSSDGHCRLISMTISFWLAALVIQDSYGKVR